MLNFRFVKDYLLHRIRAKNRHGLHSPFVYQLVDSVIYDHTAQKTYHEIENIRKKLLVDNRVISVTDLGAGSHLNNNREKRIGDIAANALKQPKLAQLLYRLAARFKPRNIIELGTCLGITTLYLQEGAPNAHIYTMEGCPQTAGVAKETFEQAGFKEIELITGNFDDNLPGVIRKLDQLDFVFVDGNHQKDPTLHYFKLLSEKIIPSSILIFDDIHWSKEMEQAWKMIRDDSSVKMTIDLFFMGLVFFNTGFKAKQHFSIRF